MSRIRRLSFRGIRNFGDENEEESLIRFQRPLTLILGPNGTGKTTIIEALKYVTTGDYPPNSNNGRSFIYDPVLTKTASVRCGVKAELIDAAGNIYAINRIVESVRCNRTLKIKSLDNTFTRVKEGVSISNRCADINVEVLHTMGVSKALLNYVIFCHQEELNWPFEEGAQLKKKFDEIFDTAIYQKALEEIRRVIKDQTEDLRVMKIELEYLSNTVQEVKNKEEKLKAQQDRLQTVKDKIANIDERLEPVALNISESEKADAVYKKKLSEYESKQVEHNLCKQQMDDLKKNIQEILDTPMEELNKETISYDEILEQKSREIEELEIRLKHKAKEESRIEKMLAEERITLGSLKQQLEYQKKRINLRNKTLQTALSSWNLGKLSDDVSETEVTALIRRLDEKMKNLQDDVNNIRQNMEEEERNYQKKVDVVRAEKSKIESEKNVKEHDMAKIKEELRQICARIADVGAAGEKLNSIEAEHKNASDNVEKLQKAMDIEAKKTEIQKKIKSRDRMEDELNKVDEEIASLLKQSSLKAELDLHTSTLLSAEKKIQLLKAKHEKNLKWLLEVEELPQNKLKERLESVQEKMATEVKSLSEKVRNLQQQLTTFQATQKYEEKELNKMMSELESDKEKIASICDYKNFDEFLLLQAKVVKDLQDKRGMYAYQNVAYKEYLKKLKEKDPCCPLCHRGFAGSDDLEHLMTEMTDEMQNHPDRLKQCEDQLKMQQQKYDTLLQLTPVVDKVKELENRQLKKLVENVERTKVRIKSVEKSVEKLQISLKDPEDKQEKCKEIINDVLLWDQYLSEIQKCNRQIQDVKVRLGNEGIDSKRSIDDAQAERERLKTAVKNIRHFIESTQSQLNAHMDKLQRARNKCNELHEEQLKIRSEMQKLKQYQDKKTELQAQEVSLAALIQNLKQNLQTAVEALDVAIRNLEKLKRHNSTKLDTERKRLEEGSSRLSELRKMQKEVDNFIQENISDALSDSEQQIENYNKSIKTFAYEKETLQVTIGEMKDDISRQELIKRNLIDNITLRKLEEKAQKLTLQCKELKMALSAMNHEETLREWKELKQQEKMLLREKNIAKGNEQELERSVKHYETELEKDENKKAQDRYLHKLREKVVTEEIILNFKAYSKALDYATIRYHEERINTVNKIMKRLWEIVYKGNDTSCISLQAQATEGVGSARRTYNYKLVQKKHGVEMDMRGRCSAGQKVLASIIIRLALAETFCSNCSILALDEPTTNLDDENANSLADALSLIINHRHNLNKNFQLVLITHDEKFMTKLANLSDTRTFYELYRKNNGRTGIKYSEIGGDMLPATLKGEESSASEDEDHQDSGVATQQSSQQQKKQTTKKKRWNEDDDGESSQGNPSKKRYVFKM